MLGWVGVLVVVCGRDVICFEAQSIYITVMTYVLKFNVSKCILLCFCLINEMIAFVCHAEIGWRFNSC